MPFPHHATPQGYVAHSKPPCVAYVPGSPLFPRFQRLQRLHTAPQAIRASYSNLGTPRMARRGNEHDEPPRIASAPPTAAPFPGRHILPDCPSETPPGQVKESNLGSRLGIRMRRNSGHRDAHPGRRPVAPHRPGARIRWLARPRGSVFRLPGSEARCGQKAAHTPHLDRDLPPPARERNGRPGYSWGDVWPRVRDDHLGHA